MWLFNRPPRFLPASMPPDSKTESQRIADDILTYLDRCDWTVSSGGLDAKDAVLGRTKDVLQRWLGEHLCARGLIAHPDDVRVAIVQGSEETFPDPILSGRNKGRCRREKAMSLPVFNLTIQFLLLGDEPAEPVDLSSIPELASAVEGLELAFTHDRASKHAIARLGGPTGSYEDLQQWFAEHAAIHCLRILSTCWNLLPRDWQVGVDDYVVRQCLRQDLIMARDLTRRWHEIGTRRDNSGPGSRLQKVTRAIGAACYRSCFLAVESHLANTAGRDAAVEIARWLEWFRPACYAWQRKLVHACATSDAPADWLPALDASLGALVDGAEVALVADSDDRVVVAVDSPSEPDFAPAMQLDPHSRHSPSTLQALPHGIDPRKYHLRFCKSMGRPVLVCDNTDSNAQWQFTWNGGVAWKEHGKDAVHVKAVLDATGQDSYCWHNGWRFPGEREMLEKRVKRKLVEQLLEHRQNPCPGEHFAQLAAWLHPTVGSSLRNLLQRCPPSQGFLPANLDHQRAVWEALLEKHDRMVSVYQAAVGNADSLPGAEQIAAWMEFLLSLEGVAQ